MQMPDDAAASLTNTAERAVDTRDRFMTHLLKLYSTVPFCTIPGLCNICVRCSQYPDAPGGVAQGERPTESFERSTVS